MPNWCNNVARISHENPEMIQRMIAAANNAEKGVLQEFVPCPADLLLDGVGSYGGPNAAENDALRAANKEKYGFESWYEWNVANWGTKWDLCEPVVDTHDANNITLTFQTAWAPPIEAYGTLEAQGFVVEAYWYEPGMMFCGMYEDGCVEDLEIEEATYEWAKDNIPRNIEEMFGIADEFAQWEAENESE
jgi:hypothetical protein